VFKKVLWATDGSDSADRALEQAKSLGKDAGASVLVVHCEEMTLPGKGGGSRHVIANEEDVVDKIKRQVAELSGDGIDATFERTKTKVGGAAHAIVDIAAEAGADVIVVGSRGHTPLAGLLIGSVPQRLLHISPVPVLVVPTGD
jgi:nucleotide-binding universal stress UspA family protein